jgi:hypothetical protein
MQLFCGRTETPKLRYRNKSTQIRQVKIHVRNALIIRYVAFYTAMTLSHYKILAVIARCI